MPLQATSGAASYDGFGGGVAAVPNYIEDVFSTYLYTGNGSTQAITNGIDLSTKGGLVWIKSRNTGTTNHQLFDTARGISQTLLTNDTGPSQNVTPYGVCTFGTTDFTVRDTANNAYQVNGNNTGQTFASWTFRKQPKFFDVVTYTGTGSVQNIAHSLGSVPACMIVKGTTQASAGNWNVYHKDIGNGNRLILNSTAASAAASTTWNNTDPTSTQFTVGTSSQINNSGDTYVAYLFAHNAGGFGLTGTDNVISCGSFTSSGNYPQITLGYEPQWVLIKRTDSATDGDWMLADVMRPGFNANAALGNEATYILKPNTSGAETTGVIYAGPNSTGFSGYFGAGSRSFIYIAIRRGPMKVPVDANKVFAPVAYTGTGATRTITAGFPVDLAIPKLRNAATNGAEWYTRLIGPNIALLSAYTAGELARPNELTSFASNTGVVLGDSSTSGGTNASGSTYVDWNFGRAPSFFDEVCYTGIRASRYTNVPQTVTHGLNAVPELIILKSRSNNAQWIVYAAPVTANKYLQLQSIAAAVSSSGGDDYWNSQTPSNTEFYLGQSGNWDNTCYVGYTYVAYLFATCAGVSKVFSFTGTGSLQTINCGFTSGARFVLVKRTDSTGDWYVWDSARGISSSTDPYLLLNSTAAEVTSTNWVDTTSTGFQVTAASGNNVNINGATYIGLAIA